jgi:putative endonuclease
MVRCADGTLYTGYARNPEHRARVHNSGRGARYTASRLPVTLVYVERYDSHSDALKREHQLKRSTRSDKEALIGATATPRDAAARARGSAIDETP